MTPFRSKQKEPISISLEEMIETRIRSKHGNLMNGKELTRLADRCGCGRERVIDILKKLGFELSNTYNGQRIWRKRSGD